MTREDANPGRSPVAGLRLFGELVSTIPISLRGNSCSLTPMNPTRNPHMGGERGELIHELLTSVSTGTYKYCQTIVETSSKSCREPVGGLSPGRRDAVPARWGLCGVDRRRDPALLRPLPSQRAVQDCSPTDGPDARQDRPGGRGGLKSRRGLTGIEVHGCRRT